MATNKNEETRTAIDEVNDSLTGIEQKMQKNQKGIMWACVIVAAVVCLVLLYVYGIRKPGIEAANNAIGQADVTLASGNDSLALVQYKQVADEYGYDAGNRAKLNAATLLYQHGKYQEALDYVKRYKRQDQIIGAAAKSLEGDCNVNLKNYEEAIKCFQEAAKISDKNPAYTPTFMMKEATVQHALKNYKAEAEVYRAIKKDYPLFGASLQLDIDKFISRAETLAGQTK